MVYAAHFANEVAVAVDAADHIILKPTDMAADRLATDLQKAEEQARVPGQALAPRLFPAVP